MTVSREKEQSAVPEVGSVVCNIFHLKRKLKTSLRIQDLQLACIYINSDIFLGYKKKDYR